MAQFYASIQGNRGEATRMGTKSSGIDGHIRGWGVGARVNVIHNATTGLDEVEVFITGGSSGKERDKPLGTFSNVLGNLQQIDRAEQAERQQREFAEFHRKRAIEHTAIEEGRA